MAPRERLKQRKDEHAISRIDNDQNGTHAWKVHLQRRKQIFVRLFTDGVHGGTAQALAAARSYRNDIIAKYPPLTRREYASIKRRNNTSGVPGVCRYTNSSNGRGRPYWVAFWTVRPSEVKRVKFSVEKYGEKQARRLAINARHRGLEELEGFFGGLRQSRRKSVKPSTATLSVPPRIDARVRRVRITRSKLSVELQDGRVIAVPLVWYPKLQKANERVRHAWELNEAGDAIRWTALGLTITTAAALLDNTSEAESNSRSHSHGEP